MVCDALWLVERGYLFRRLAVGRLGDLNAPRAVDRRVACIMRQGRVRMVRRGEYLYKYIIDTYIGSRAQTFQLASGS